MKPALVLGLALAANAMVADSSYNNELFVAPQGKLADLAKKYPGMIMFDEQADDELVALEKKHPFEESKHAIFLRGQRERERKLREQMKLNPLSAKKKIS